jgi:ubiquinol-cytochrome c reductase cytochrome b subunit
VSLSDPHEDAGRDRARLPRWLDERTGVFELARSLRAWREPRSANRWLALGGVLAFALAGQIATGLLLLVHFVPAPDEAFASVEHIMRDVPYGWWIRLLHAHGANWMVAVLFAHVASVALAGRYKQPRELVWVVGCVLLVLTLGMALTGYILPWSQLSYWATTVVTASLDYMPVVGHEMMTWVRGGEVVGPATFRRAFVAHAILLPGLLVTVVALHLLLLKRVGLAPAHVRRSADPPRERALPFFPDFALKYAILFVGFALLIVTSVTWAPNLFFPVDHLTPADPFVTPANVKPEWYFLWAYQLPRLVPESLALALQGLAFLCLVMLPFVDRSRLRHPFDRPVVTLVLLVSMAAVVVLSIMGYRA